MMFSCSGNLATMACGLPYAIAAAIAYPRRQVVAFVGDGGLTMLMGELATCVKYKLDVKIIVIKNNALGQIKWEQMVFLGNPEYGCELQPIDFAAVARGFGAQRLHHRRPGSAARCCARRWRRPGPVAGRGGGRSARAADAAQGRRSKQAAHFAEALARGTPAARQDRADGRRPTKSARLDLNGGCDAELDASHRARHGAAPSASRPTRRRPTAPSPGTRTTMVAGRGRGRRRNGTWLHLRRRAAAADVIDECARRRRRRHRMSFAIPALWAGHGRAVRNIGWRGIAALAISAVDIALWDLKARLLGCRFALLGAARAKCRSTAAAASPPIRSTGCSEQLAGWVEPGLPLGQDEGRQRSRRGSRPRAGRAATRSGDADAVRRCQRRLSPQAGACVRGTIRRARRRAGSRSRCRATISRACASCATARPAGMEIAAGEYGYDRSISAACSRPAPSTCSRPTPRAAVAITGFLQAAAHCRCIRHSALGALRARAASARLLRGAAAAASWNGSTTMSASSTLLFDGAPKPRDGLIAPDRAARPRLDFKRADAERLAA